MRALLIVGFGGFLGSIARYKLGGWILHHTTAWKFPLSTFIVNVLGCLIAGILAGLVEKHDFFSSSTRLFLFAGLLGGFTTFSAFGLETVYLLQKQELLLAAINVSSSVLVGMFVLWLSIKIISV